MTAVTIAALKSANAARWGRMHIDVNLAAHICGIAARLIQPSAKARYLTVSQQTGIPWFVVAVIHERESSQSWLASLAQGDPWSRVSVHVPKGRGPFLSWESAAIDALEHCPPYAAKWTDWTIGGALTLLEQYNGLGYANRNLPSPYIWASTNQYQKGKYVADGHFDQNAIDQQIGCAALLSAMTAQDSSIKIVE